MRWATISAIFWGRMEFVMLGHLGQFGDGRRRGRVWATTRVEPVICIVEATERGSIDMIIRVLADTWRTTWTVIRLISEVPR
jgi:hypothetical protein